MQTAKILNFPRKVWRTTTHVTSTRSLFSAGLEEYRRDIGGDGHAPRGFYLSRVVGSAAIHSDHRLALVETEESTILGTPPKRFYALARQ